MMAKAMARAEAQARTRQRERTSEIAAQLNAILGDANVEVEEARVLVRGRGIVKRWLIDPNLRFLVRGLR